MELRIYRALFSVLLISILILTISTAISAGDKVDSFSLVVYGGEPEGVMTAVAAAREGIDTLLVMEREKPGGLMTYGGLNYLDLNYSPEGINLNQGLFYEWHQQVGNSISFSIAAATRAFKQMLEAEDRLTVYNNCELIEVKRNKNQIEELVFTRENNIKKIKVNRVIDATQNADLAVAAGVPYFRGGADIGLPDRHMAVTLVLHFSNIDWKKLKVDADSNKFGPSYINKDHAWGFVQIGELYQPVEDDVKLRGLNIVLDRSTEKAEGYINSLLLFNVDPTDPESLEDAYQRGKREAVHVLDFFRENLSGFAEARLPDFPAELYIRESRHILADYQLQLDDLWLNRIFEDSVALASYPLDYQAATAEYNGFVLFNPDVYGIPLRSLIPLTVSNMLVVGRSSGYSSLAAASARVLPTGMAAGEAAGIASAISLKNEISYRELSSNIDLLEEIQKKVGIRNKMKRYSSRFFSSNKIDEDFFPYFEELLSWGLIIGGYNNDFCLDESISEREFAHMIIKGLKRREAPVLYEWVPGSLETLSSLKNLTRDQAAMLLLAAISKRVLLMDRVDYFPTACRERLIPEIIQKDIPVNRLLTRREAYMIIAHFLDQYPFPVKLKRFRGERL